MPAALVLYFQLSPFSHIIHFQLSG
jgi:hypothetical protein